MLHRFCSLLKRQYNPTDEVPPHTNGLITTFRQFLEKVAADRRVVFIVDALNHLEKAHNAERLRWLPWKFSPQQRTRAECLQPTLRPANLRKVDELPY